MDRRVLRRVDPSDVLQDAFVDGTRSLSESPALGWVLHLTHQRLLSVHRTHLKTQSRDLERERALSNSATSVAAIAHPTRDASTPSGVACRKEEIAKIRDAFSALSSEHREIIELRALRGLGNEEVASLLSLSKTAASNRYSRALQQLKKGLGSHDE